LNCFSRRRETASDETRRYAVIDRRDAIQSAFDAILGVVDEVIAIELADVERARTIVPGMPKLSARDALHAAVMGRQNIDRIMTFDTAFDAVAGLSRYRV